MASGKKFVCYRMGLVYTSRLRMMWIVTLRISDFFRGFMEAMEEVGFVVRLCYGVILRREVVPQY